MKAETILKQGVCRAAASDTQSQTEKCFAYKWAQKDSYESDVVREKARVWLLDRYFEGSEALMDELFAGGQKVFLDAGCGSGHSALILFGDKLNDHDYIGIDISSASEVARERFKAAGVSGDFAQCDISADVFVENSCDVIFSEGVMHHTDDTRKTFLNLVKALKPGGTFLFYVYARKAVIREFMDDHIRERLLPLSEEEAWEALRPLTLLGKALGDMDVKVTIPEDIDLLDIKKGEYDLQRFFYWYIAKAYYDPDYSIEEMNHVNFDWYRPRNCHRHTPEEVTGWCREAGLEIQRMDVQESGITVVAHK